MNRRLFFISKYKVEGVEEYCTLKQCINFCKNNKEVGLDIETSRHPILGDLENDIYKGGLDPYLSRVIMLQLGTLECQFAIDMRDFTNEELKPLIDYLHWNEDTVFIGQNLKFEGKHLRHNYGIRLNRVYDTMLAELCLYNGVTESLTLAGLAEKYLGVKKKNNAPTLFDEVGKIYTNDDYYVNNPDLEDKVVTPFEMELTAEMDKSIRMQFVKLTDEPFNSEQLIYGIEDIIYPILIKKEQDKGHNLLGYHFHNPHNIQLESQYTQVGADMEYNGLPFSEEKWSALDTKNSIIYEERLKALNEYIIVNVPKFYTPTLFGDECLIEWQSPKQVIALFRHFDACPKEKSKQTKQMEYSVGSKALLPTLPNNLKDDYGKDKWHDIKDVDTLKLAYLLLKKSQMNVTTYGNVFLKYIHPLTKRVHPNYRLHLISSRTATTKPNLLAIPNSHRGAFTTEGTDKSLVINDYSSQESRVIAAKSGDPLLTSFFNLGHEVFGDDFHSYTSALVHKVRDPSSNIEVVPKGHENYNEEMGKMRQDTKAVNFGLAYGITAISLSKQLGIPMIEAEDLVDSYFETFPDLNKFLKDSQSDALKSGSVLFEPKFKAIYIQKDYAEILKKEEECKSYFFNDHYKELSKEERVEYKANLYATKPHIKEWFTDVGITKSRLGNRGCNLKIQGTSAKQSKVAQVNMRKYSVLHPELGWEICLLLHDEVVSEVPEEHKDKVVELQGKYMKVAAEYFCPTVKFETSGGASKVWDH